MQNIASEFCITWDSNAFQQRMAKTPESTKVCPFVSFLLSYVYLFMLGVEGELLLADCNNG